MHPESPLLLSEFLVNEEQPLAEIHRSILHHLQNRDDVVVFGAQAVNAYVSPARMTEDIDLMSRSAESLADELCKWLHQEFQMASRVRTVASGKGFRVYQRRSSGTRHLIDIRQVDELPEYQVFQGLAVVSPAELIALKVISSTLRAGTPKAMTDQADLMRLLLAFPEHQTEDGDVTAALQKLQAADRVIQAWQQWTEKTIQPDTDEY
jgi:hypothetical protein